MMVQPKKLHALAGDLGVDGETCEFVELLLSGRHS